MEEEPMEKRQQPNNDGGGRRSPKRKKKTPTSTPPTHLPLDDLNNILSLLLAASLSGNSPDRTLLTNCLRKLHFRVLSETLPDHLLLPILALVPSLLFSGDPRVARRGAEIVGAMSLQSLEMNERIVMDGETVRALVSLLDSSTRGVSMAACNSLLDLCATSVGRRQLLKCFALERLLNQFLQVPASSTSVFLLPEDKADVSHLRIALKQDGYFISIIYGAVILINTCNIQQLDKIPRKLSDPFMFFLKSLWLKVREQVLLGRTLKSCRGTQSHLSNIHVNELAESLFRLSINVRDFAILAIATIKRRIFKDEGTHETFMLSYWEAFPYHLRGPSDYDIEDDYLFSPFAQNFNCQKPSPTFLRSILESITSCPPMASNELDISHFLEEVRVELGCPIIYQQDIRVVRTEMQSKRELHYFGMSLQPSGLGTRCFTMSDIMKCEEAFKQGYTIALRGMGFRLLSIASIADALASLFGQPSAGANMYLTPPNSQGLARHFDDHCVFVFQLVGTKRWKVYPQLNFQLPCLYDSFSDQCAADVESSSVETMELLLKAGDMLYIPRGMAHEACGGADAAFSLHLTFSIELEPPFEWEGFAHVALHCWNQMQSRAQHASVESLSGSLDIMSVNLLHATIEHIGASDPTFRKACLVGAIPLQLDSKSRLNLNQKSTFEHVINKIGTTSSFHDILRKVERDIEEHKDPFQRMRWFQLLGTDQETLDENDWSTPFREFQRLLPVYVQHKDSAAEVAFIEVRSKFCSEVQFENIIDQYKRLLEMYRKTRMQYTNGMLSLHCQ